MHAHLLGESWNAMVPPQEQLARKDIPFESFLFPYVAKGVTTVQVLAIIERLLLPELWGGIQFVPPAL
jgi:hypothetical protein